jgi:competence ComEA-like helix-hairpin-helix protein
LEEEGQPAEAQPAEELPEWLRQAATEEAPAEAQPAESSPAWMMEEEGQPAEAQPAEELPEWLRQMATEEAPAPVQPAESLPAWMIEEEGQSLLAAQPTPEEEPLPDWLKAGGVAIAAITAAELSGETQPTPEEAIEEVESQAEPVQKAAVAGEQMEDALAWLQSMMTFQEPEAPAEPQTPSPAPPAPQPAAMPTDEDAAFAWLEALAVKQGAQEALLLKPEERVEKPPEWVEQAVRQVEEEHEEVESSTAGLTAVAAAAALAAQAIPEREETAEPAIEARAEPEEAFIEPQAEIETVQPAQPSEVRPASTESPSVSPDDESAFAWLESLAVRQGAQEALLLKPEERQEAPPEWVLQQEQQAMQEMAPEAPQAQEVSAPAKLAEIPAVEPVPEPVVQEAPPVTKPRRQTGGLPPLPDWLAQPAAETSEELEWTPPPVPKRKYDLNKASLGELERLPGVGFIMAQRIVDYRYQYGSFRYVEDLLNVPEFTQATLDGIRDNLVIESRPPTGPLSPRPVPATANVLLIHEDDAPADLNTAREMLGQGYLDEALHRYAQLIQKTDLLPKVITDLEDASAIYPHEINIWQQLGDAYLLSNQMNEALKAYTKAEELLR